MLALKNLAALLILFLFISCNYTNCNYKKLNNNEYKIIEKINEKTIHIDTIYNDRCLIGFFRIYINEKSTNPAIEKEIEKVLFELLKEKMSRHIWVFNKDKKFLYRLYKNKIKDEFIKTKLQYPNQ